MTDINNMDQVLTIIQQIIEEQIPFNKVLGIKVATLTNDEIQLRVDMRKELVGNFVRGILHGGVISSCMDITGGFVAFLEVLKMIHDKPMQEKVARFSKLGTIDLRVDYLRPGSGDYFITTGYMLRIGQRVAVTRMEMHNDSNELIAVGTGAYIVA